MLPIIYCFKKIHLKTVVCASAEGMMASSQITILAAIARLLGPLAKYTGTV